MEVANDFSALPGAAIEGTGLAQVPEPIAARAVTASQSVHVLERFAFMIPGVFLYYHGGRHNAGNETRIRSVLHRTGESHHVATSGASPVAWCDLEIQGFRGLAARMVRSRSSSPTTFGSRAGTRRPIQNTSE